MFVPTCATCHMSGINGLKVTHDPSERLSYYLADAITNKRPNYAARAGGHEAGLQSVPHQLDSSIACTSRRDMVVSTTNDRVRAAQEIVNGLRKDGVLHGKPFRHPIDFVYFDLWHYDGRTAKARRVHGRRRFRPVARQLSDGQKACGPAIDGGRSAAETLILSSHANS